jgi:hypothetical protein
METHFFLPSRHSVRLLPICSLCSNGWLCLFGIFRQGTKKNDTFIYIALAILFQPFIKIALGRTIWNIVNVIVGVGLILSIATHESKK